MFPLVHERRLLAALAVSALLHAALLGARDLPGLFAPAAQPLLAPALQVRLRPPDVEPLLKNTLAENAGSSSAAPGGRAAAGAARRKLAEHLFYPPEAIARGLEGEVRLHLKLDPDGNLLETRIVTSSGHPLLDRAAMEAIQTMHRLDGAGVREMILPVIFKLQ